MNYKRQKLELKNGMAEIITIQTNEQNSLTLKSMRELESILEEIKKDDSIKGVIFNSENPKFFSNGLDAETLVATPDAELVDAVGGICVLFGAFLRFDKPAIAEISGHAMGGGAVISIGCDYKYMLEKGCRFSFTEVMFGLPLPGMFVYKIQETVPANKVAEVCMEAKSYKASEAKEVGLIDDIATDLEQLRKLSIKKLETLFQFPLSAIRYTKQNVNKKSLMDYETHLSVARSSFMDPTVKRNMLEAMTAFKEKRKPKFI
jgi:enoyl-CoA hydratase